MIPLILTFSFISFVIFCIYKHEQHIKSIRKGMTVRVLNGYYEDQIGEVLEYVPETYISPFTKKPRQFKVLLNDGTKIYVLPGCLTLERDE